MPGRSLILACSFALAPMCWAGTDSGGPAGPAALGISFNDGSTSTLTVEREGVSYVVDLVARTVRPADDPAAPPPAPEARSKGAVLFAHACAPCHGNDGKGIRAFKTPDFTDPKTQARFTDEEILKVIKNGKRGTAMRAWSKELSSEEILLLVAYIRSLGAVTSPPGATGSGKAAGQRNDVYQAGDDVLVSLPTGRPVDRHGLIVNFTHRFAYDPAFSGAARGGALFGLDGFSISSFGLRYGVTDRLSVSGWRSPTFIARPIQLMAAYTLLSESHGAPLNLAARLSVEGQDNFTKNFTENFEAVLSRSITGRAQAYVVPTVSLGSRRLFSPSSFRSGAIPTLPGYNSFALGLGGSVDVRPTVALLAEAIPTLVNGRPLGIHRPAFSFGIQKKIWRHAFTLAFGNSPGTTVSQRAGTRAAFLGDPSADTFRGLVIGFDLTRQIH